MIRKMKFQDLDAVMKIWLDSNEQAHDFVPKEYWKDHYEQVRDMLPESEVYVYEAEGEIQGFAGLMEDYIAGIFVAEKFRSKGIGKLLMKYLKERKQKLSLSVYVKNQAAVRFYQREDFQIRTEGVDEATGEAEYEMTWEK